MDESEFAGFVDSGIFELEHWIDRYLVTRKYQTDGMRKLMKHLELIDND